MAPATTQFLTCVQVISYASSYKILSTYHRYDNKDFHLNTID